MEKSREKLIEVIARDNAKWDKCFVDLPTLGYVSNTKFSTYNPPNDSEGRAVYDHHWNKAKEKQ